MPSDFGLASRLLPKGGGLGSFGAGWIGLADGELEIGSVGVRVAEVELKRTANRFVRD